MNRVTLKQVSIIVLSLYIITLFVFNFDPQLNVISQVLFIFSFGTTVFSLCMKCKKPKLKFIYFYVLVMTLIAVLSTFWSIDKSYAFSQNLTFIQLMLLIIIVYNNIDTIDDVKILLDSIFIGGFLMCLYAFVYYGLEGIINSFSMGIRLGGDINQENTFGFFSNITFFIGLYKVIYEKKYKLIFLIILPFIFIILSGSRKAVFILLLILPLILSLKYNKNIILKITFFYVGLLVLILIFNYINITSPLFNRFNILTKAIFGNSNLDNSSLVRIEMVEFGWYLFQKRPILGYGTNQYNILYYHNFGMLRPSHNNYIQFMVSYGLVGLIWYYSIFIFLLCFHYKLIRRFDKISILLFLLILILLIHDIGADTFREKLKYIIFAISSSYYSIIKNKLGKKIENVNGGLVK